MPAGINIYNANVRCDRLVGPCVCGGWHGARDIIEIARGRGFLTQHLEDAVNAAIRRSVNG